MGRVKIIVILTLVLFSTALILFLGCSDDKKSVISEQDADVNVKDEDDNPPIAYSESVEMSNLLRKYGAKDAVRKEPGLKTVESYKQAIKVGPDNANAHVLLGAAYHESVRYKEAVEAYKQEAYKQVIKVDPDDATTHVLFGHIYIELGMCREAIEACKQAIRANPDNASAHFILGASYIALGMCKEAIESYKQGIRINPDQVEAHYNLGIAYIKSDMYKEAIESYKQAIKVDPDYANAHYSLGIIYSSKDRGSALEQYKILKSLDFELANKLFNQISK